VDAGHALLAVMKKDRPFLSHLNVCHWAVHRGGGDGWVPGHSHPHFSTGYLMSNFPDVNFCQNGNCPCKNVISTTVTVFRGHKTRNLEIADRKISNRDFISEKCCVS
jgi:hypothetical protein